MLVDWIGREHADRPGILVWCRLDYRLGKMWASLGFSRGSERPGRGKGQRTLVAWWRDHGHARLFERDPETVLVRASLDLNVVRDITEPTRPDSAESVALVSDQLADRLELVRTPALDVEIDALDDPLRTACMRQAELFTPVRPTQDRFAAVQAQLFAEATQVDPTFVASRQGQMDVRYASEAAAASVNVLVTRDEAMTEALKAAAERFGLRILRPAEVVVHLDELVRADAYRPVAFQETEFTRVLIGAGQGRELLLLANGRSGEKTKELDRRLRELTTAGLDRVGFYSPDRQLVAAFITNANSGMMEVPFLRVADGPIANTLARQIVFLLRQEARTANVCVIRLSDPFLSRSTIAAASDDGFMPFDGSHYAFVIDVCGASAEVAHAAVVAARTAALPPPASIRSGLGSVAAAEVERVWWPAKVVDSLLPSYLVPIRQSFSRELLGFPRGLFGRSPDLGLSREHVYYRSSRGPTAKAPARLLWYMSGSSPGTVEPAGVIAASLLEEVVEGTPEELHSRFRHLGVWQLEEIQKASRGSSVQALRFSNTELLPRPVSLSRLRALGFVAPQAPLQIDSDAYAALYRDGQRDG